MRDLISLYLNKNEDIDEFALWAFGPNYESYNGGLQFLSAWNSLRELDQIIFPSSDVRESLKFMVNLWRQTKENAQ